MILRDYYPNTPITRANMLQAIGTGNWRRFTEAGYTMRSIADAVAAWREAVQGNNKLWLCWSVNPDWCIEQQKQVLSVGWTPLVGHDPRTEPPPILPGSLFVNFNAELNLPVLWPHFPLELAHLWVPARLAFWHSDLLVRPEKLQAIAETFAALSNGWMAATKPRFSLRETIMGRLRYWELIGCTTRKASEDAFAAGCGWWQGWPWHPSNSMDERHFMTSYYWDHGAGIRYWHKRCGGKVVLIPESFVSEGHFTGIGNAKYKRSVSGFGRNLAADLPANYSLGDAKRKLGIA